MSVDAVLDRVDRETAASLDQLKEYLRIPSVSTDPAYAGDVRRCAGFVRERLEAAGLEAEIIETAGHPLVYGEWLGAPGRPTVLFYGHYDVQPVDPLGEWRNDPFEPTIETGERGERIVARGATDDKGQSFTHIKAVEATMAETGGLPVNVKFLIEGEEERGGEAIEAYVRSPESRRLGCDLALVSDTSMYGPGQPSVLYGLKGLLYTEVRVRGAGRDLHSGTFGGAVANPLNVLGTMLAALRDPRDGRILVPGFYDDVRPLGAEERAAFAALPFDEARYGEVENLNGAPPVLVDLDGPLVDAALEGVREAWGREPVRVREGGSIPIVSTLSEVLGAPVLLIGFGLSDDRLHAPNEKMDLSNFYQGIRTVVRVLDRLGGCAAA
ncbi:MAG: M20/M25/M40 family metallo-hydrolase [Acidobacteriota bacterium]|nr:M20/M25/M40 family metallo-hydrolase [Acidobacteriota bacterium]